ncbi:hypothetical protein FJ434_16505 [Mesorhizobium sp. B2-5-13]|nr:hypothetical protein FJ434_16505 [Mesorhizobium sp. B2-5-13]TPK39279.1 hypothetical protein FJ560_29355 [Mesorhizobium sp. B2-5-5]
MAKTSRHTPSASRPTPQDKWRAANPLAIWAHAALRSAINRGLIQKEPCEVCGASEVDGHHEDYGKPMEVRWLCRLHHKGEHKRLRCEEVT